jgi:hypothetical protein
LGARESRIFVIADVLRTVRAAQHQALLVAEMRGPTEMVDDFLVSRDWRQRCEPIDGRLERGLQADVEAEAVRARVHAVRSPHERCLALGGGFRGHAHVTVFDAGGRRLRLA